LYQLTLTGEIPSSIVVYETILQLAWFSAAFISLQTA